MDKRLFTTRRAESTQSSRGLPNYRKYLTKSYLLEALVIVVCGPTWIHTSRLGSFRRKEKGLQDPSYITVVKHNYQCKLKCVLRLRGSEAKRSLWESGGGHNRYRDIIPFPGNFFFVQSWWRFLIAFKFTWNQVSNTCRTKLNDWDKWA